MLRRYGNVVIHECESVRYVEYSVLSDETQSDTVRHREAPNVTRSGTPPDQEGAAGSLFMPPTQSTDGAAKRARYDTVGDSADEREQDICERKPHPYFT